MQGPGDDRDPQDVPMAVQSNFLHLLRKGL